MAPKVIVTDSFGYSKKESDKKADDYNDCLWSFVLYVFKLKVVQNQYDFSFQNRKSGVLIITDVTGITVTRSYMGTIYGYCRISRPSQNIERQVRNIKEAFPSAIVRQEVYTGTKYQGRKELEKIINTVREGDTIVFDSVSRMSRNAEEGFNLYEILYERGVNLVFLKEPTINTTAYRAALASSIPLTGSNVDLILKGVNAYLKELRREQIRLAFTQSEKEVSDLHQRTKEGIETARLNGKQIGRKKGSGYITAKEIKSKELILKHSKSFGGTLADEEVMKLCGIARCTYYKYKKELKTR